MKSPDESIVLFPPADSPLGFHSAAREVSALTASLLNPPPYPDVDLPRGQGRTVLFIPGFMTGDWAMYRLRHFLENLDYKVEFAGLLLNPGPTSFTLERLESAFARLTDEGPIALVGQSFGGVLARGLIRKHPNKVLCLITLGTPIRFPIVSPLAPIAQFLAPFHDKSWVEMRSDIACSPGIPSTAIYSEDDGYVDWRQCLQDEAANCINVKISGAHTTMASNPEGQIAVAQALARAAAP